MTSVVIEGISHWRQLHLGSIYKGDEHEMYGIEIAHIIYLYQSYVRKLNIVSWDCLKNDLYIFEAPK